jgi:undecaprenyl-diphosphatase
VLFDLDVSLFEWLTAWRAPWLDTAMAAASDVGRRGFVWFVLAAVAAIYPRHRAAAWRLVLALGLTFFLVNAVAKPLAGRARPFEALDHVDVIDARPLSGSFPSGHAASAFAGALAASRIWPAARLAFFALAALIALSRVYVGVHFPADVLAGALTGLACAWFAIGGRDSLRS